MSRKLFILVCVVSLVLSSASLVSADYGPYVGVRGDVSFLNDAQVSAGPSEDNPALDVTAKTQTGYAVRGAVGYAFQNNFRLEAEVGYRNNGLNSMDVRSPGGLAQIAIDASGQFPAGTPFNKLSEPRQQAILAETNKTHALSGNTEAITLLANGYYDFHLESGLKPYIGAGLGVSFISADVDQVSTGRKLVDDSDAVFAYQAFAGVGYEVNLAGRPVTLLLDYSYFASQNPTVKGATTGGEFEFEFTGHYLGLGALFFFEGW